MSGLSRFQPDVRAAIEGLLEIVSKNGEWVPFRLNAVQARLAKDRRKRTVILKARQMGVTSYIMAENICTCLALDNVRCVMVAHDKDHTVRLMRRLRAILERLNAKLKAHGVKPVKFVRNSDSEVEFSSTRSTIYIGTAGSKAFGRSDTIHRLHCSEVAFWPNAEELVAGLLQAVPRDGVVYWESTANGFNYFHRLWQQAESGRALTGLFYPWHIFEEYRATAPDDFELTEEEERLAREFGLSRDQLYWRRLKIEGDFYGKVELFKQEYPMLPEEAFVSSGRNVFPDVKLVSAPAIDFMDEVFGFEEFLVLSGHPRNGWDYVIGCDPAGGTGGDYTAIVIAGVSPEGETMLVGVGRDRFIRPHDTGTFLARLGRMFNLAYIVCERNSIGIAVLDQLLREDYPTHRVWREFVKRRDKFGKTIKALEYGLYTSRKKGLLISAGQSFLSSIGGVWHEQLYAELKEFRETDSGGYEGSGEHDDLVIAFCLAGFGFRSVYGGKLKRKSEEVQVLERAPGLGDFRFEVRFEDIFGRSSPATPWIFHGRCD